MKLILRNFYVFFVKMSGCHFLQVFFQHGVLLLSRAKKVTLFLLYISV